MTNNIYLNVGYLYDKDGKAQQEITKSQALDLTKKRVELMGYSWHKLESY
jgi:hypothetical protein